MNFIQKYFLPTGWEQTTRDIHSRVLIACEEIKYKMDQGIIPLKIHNIENMIKKKLKLIDLKLKLIDFNYIINI